MSQPLFRIGAAATVLLQPPEALRERFARNRALECPEMLDPQLLAIMLRQLDTAGFAPQHVHKIGDRELETPARVGPALRLALQRRDLFDWLDRATGCGPLEQISGRVVQARAGEDHQLTWHDDREETRRRLAITINLSTAPYEGARFEIRRKKTHEPLFAHRHTAPGTALIFDVAHDIQHRVLPVTSGGPRRVFTGWFMAPM